jgi:hypothetical protein
MNLSVYRKSEKRGVWTLFGSSFQHLPADEFLVCAENPTISRMHPNPHRAFRQCARSVVDYAKNVDRLVGAQSKGAIQAAFLGFFDDRHQGSGRTDRRRKPVWSPDNKSLGAIVAASARPIWLARIEPADRDAKHVIASTSDERSGMARKSIAPTWCLTGGNEGQGFRVKFSSSVALSPAASLRSIVVPL